MLATLAVGGYNIYATQRGVTPLLAMPELIWLFFGCALVFGILMTLPIGGAVFRRNAGQFLPDRTGDYSQGRLSDGNFLECTNGTRNSRFNR
jgi:hypothetical protein